LDLCIAERWRRLHGFLEEHGRTLRPIENGSSPPCPLAGGPVGEDPDHVAWVRRLSTDDVDRGQSWLQGIVDGVVRSQLDDAPR
ncbi:MAG TPA: hypothetical protein VLD61_04605, partial [Methylomirabilota bacterium]|nr:hypothetical protein [Methylomirabilota bacterium]